MPPDPASGNPGSPSGSTASRSTDSRSTDSRSTDSGNTASRKTASGQADGLPSLQGRFITLEGIDGCGKSTQARLLAEWLRERGLTVLETREPGGTPIGNRLREVLLDPDHGAMIPVCELLLYLADRVQHLEETIRPALVRGEVVLCDRYHDATVAYQAHGRGLDLSPLAEFIDREILSTPPDCTFWLDLDVAEARRRIHQRGQRSDSAEEDGNLPEDRLDMEVIEFHQRVQKGYQAIAAAAPDRVLHIDASGDVDAVQAAIRSRLEARYGG